MYTRSKSWMRRGGELTSKSSRNAAFASLAVASRFLYRTSTPNMTEVVIPGQPLHTPSSSSASFHSGPGTFARNGSIYSSLRGKVERTGGIISVHGKDDQQAIPEPNSTVIGTITRITRQAATLSLLTVDGRPCRPDFAGVIRSQDVRQTAKDTVKVSGDVSASRRDELGD